MSRQYSNHSYHSSSQSHPFQRYRQSTPNNSSYFQHVPYREVNSRRSSIPLSRHTNAATVSPSIPHYGLENSSATSFARRPPWSAGNWEDQHRPPYYENNHIKRQRASLTSNFQSHHHQYERKRSRHNEHEHYTTHSNHRSTTNPVVTHNRSAQFHHHSPPVSTTTYRQSMPLPSLSPNTHYHQNGMISESPLYHPAPFYQQTSMSTHIHQRPSPAFLLTNLLHRIIDTHAASYSDNHMHHHPPAASIDLIAYAWISPSHEVVSLPPTFNMHFGDFFDLTIPDETPVVGLTDTELERIPTTIYAKTCAEVSSDEKCTICLSEYNPGEKVKHLRCKHNFHSECIDPWLKTSTRCPVCRGEQIN
ncbi:unnamed protein product [Adineta ricciae]|uniref:RING-type domain-containing protein n=1 Tax=Adineta ricciae TaxID=249248 RepID=A0A813SZ94_ADIRI|nr:unnamed protein product [Adineta ricciae]